MKHSFPTRRSSDRPVWVVIIGEGKMVARVEPAVIGMAQAVEAAFLDHVHISRRIACPQDRGHDQRVNGNVGNGLFRKCVRSEEHTSELQSLMRISYAVFCLKQNIKNNKQLN